MSMAHHGLADAASHTGAAGLSTLAAAHPAHASAAAAAAGRAAALHRPPAARPARIQQKLVRPLEEGMQGAALPCTYPQARTHAAACMVSPCCTQAPCSPTDAHPTNPPLNRRRTFTKRLAIQAAERHGEDVRCLLVDLRAHGDSVKVPGAAHAHRCAYMRASVSQPPNACERLPPCTAHALPAMLPAPSPQPQASIHRTPSKPPPPTSCT